MSPLLGISFKVAAAFVFTIMSAVIKKLGSNFPIGEIVFFRSSFALVPLLTWIALQGDLVGSLRTHDLRGHILRGIIGSCGMFSGFFALSFLPLSDTVAIGFAAPLFTVVLAALVLHETVRGYRWSAVIVGFAGVLVMLAPHLSLDAFSGPNGVGSAVGAVFALVGAACTAGATVQVRRLTATERTGAIVFYFSLLTTTLGLVTILFGWTMPSLAELGLLVLIGLLGGVGQIFQTQAFRYADASLVAPFDYTAMIWALLIGWFAFGQLPTPPIVIGGLVVASAGLFVIWREHRLGLDRARQGALGFRRTV